MDNRYKAISHAETGSEKNPHIRTKLKNTPGGSTAFGPAQITGTTAEGAYKAGYLSKESKKFHEEVMRPKYELMKKHGNNKGKVKDYNPRYDYGGDAEFDAKKHGASYEKYAKDIIGGVSKEAKGDEKEFVRKWRGKTEKQDPEYFKRYEEGKKKAEDEELGQEMVRQMKSTNKGME